MQKDEPRVSVIIPVYNTEKYLERCLESVFDQSFQNIEILVINDCSPDNSNEIIRRFQSRDRRLLYIRHDENLGLGGARNTGLAYASGNYIASVDSDDALTNRAIEKAVRRCEADETDICVFSAIDYIEETGKLERNALYDLADLPAVMDIDAESILRLLPTFQLKLYKRALIDRYQVRFPSRLYHEDDEFYWKLFASALPRVSILAAPLYLRTRRTDKTSIMDNERKSRKDMPRVLLNAYRFLRENGAITQVRKPFVNKVVRNLYVLTFACQEYRPEVFAGMSELLNELDPGTDEIPDQVWIEDIREIRKGDYTGYLNWKIDQFLDWSQQVQRNQSLPVMAELEQVYASTSWRITAPMRWLASKFKARNRQ